MAAVNKLPKTHEERDPARPTAPLEAPETLDGHTLGYALHLSARWAAAAAVQRRACMSLIDNLGAALAGTMTRVYAIVSGLAATTWPGDASTLLLSGKSAGAAGAAFANAAAANGIDIDDSTRYANGHGGAQSSQPLWQWPSHGLSGAQLLCGLVVGYEVAHRTGRCWHT